VPAHRRHHNVDGSRVTRPGRVPLVGQSSKRLILHHGASSVPAHHRQHSAESRRVHAFETRQTFWATLEGPRRRTALQALNIDQYVNSVRATVL